MKNFMQKEWQLQGGAVINGAFLKAGLLDEVSILIGAGIDGRKGMPGVFDGFVIRQQNKVHSYFQTLFSCKNK